MKRSIFLGLLLCMGMAVAAQTLKTCEFYVGTFTSEGSEGIYLCTFHPETGELNTKMVFKGLDNPNFLRKSADGRFMYAVSRPPRAIDPEGGAVSAFGINKDGSLRFINKQSSHGNDPCYVDVTGDNSFLAVANYGGGSVALYPLDKDGSIKPAGCVIPHHGSGPHPRQNKAYAHSIRFSANSGWVYAADLGSDRLFAYRFDQAGNRLVPDEQMNMLLPPGSGPRHFEFTRDGTYCYVINELGSTVTVFRNEADKFAEIQNISTLPSGFSGMNYGADIHMSADGKLLYASNRGHNSIVVFRIEQDGKLTPITHVSTQGNWPRNFVLVPESPYMLVANQRSHNITVFRLESGIPVFTGRELKIPAPVCLVF